MRPSHPNFPDFSPEEDHHEEAHHRKSGQSPRKLLGALLGRWHWILIGLVIGLLASSYYLSKAPKRYTATSTLLIKQKISSVLSRDQAEDIDLRTQEALNTVTERVGRFDLLERVAKRDEIRSLPGLVTPKTQWLPPWATAWLGIKAASPAASPALPVPAVLASEIAGKLKVSIRRGTRLIDITVEHVTPGVAKELADAIAREYLIEVADARSHGQISSSDVLLKESEEARSRLQVSQSAIACYTRALDLHKSLDSKEVELDAAQRRYLSKHPKMISATAEVATLKKRFLDELDTARQSPADSAYWASVEGTLDAQRNDPDARFRSARQLLLARATVLQSEIESANSVFNTMLTRLQESNVNQQSQESSAEINNLARIPALPSAPVSAKILGMGTFGGIGFGLAIAYLFVRLDNKFHTVSQLEDETGFPVLAAVTNLDSRRLADASKRKNFPTQKLGHGIAVNPQQQLWDPLLIFKPGTAATPYAEMFRVLRASISLLGDETSRRITLVTSALPGEGKSLITANLALASAAQGRSTLLIDLDLRKPRVHRFFGFDQEEGRGITGYLAKQVNLSDAITTDSGHPNLHLMLGGSRAPNPGEILNSSALGELLKEATARYDSVIIDSAPILAVPDTRLIAPLADNLCLVVRAEQTPKGAVNRTLDILDSAGTPPAGLVLNGLAEKRRRVGENYSYGGYGQYGYGTYGVYGEDEATATPRQKNQKRRAS